MNYRQLDQEKRIRIAALKCERLGMREIGRRIGRSASTVSRKIRRNAYPTDGSYKAAHADRMASGRRKRSRRVSRFGRREWRVVELLLRKDYSPEQTSGYLESRGDLRISHETIYAHVCRDKAKGGTLHTHLRCAGKRRRKRYGRYDSRGRLAGKRNIAERPGSVERRIERGHWESDTVMGAGKGWILTLVERVSGYVMIGKRADKTAAATVDRACHLLARMPEKFRTITSDNGCEFHGYKRIERRCGVEFYVANPHHSWERGTNENTNGPIRQNLKKGTNLDSLTQAECNRIAKILNTRPRKRHDWRTPEEILFGY
jgi:IS30 family transposase